MTVVGARTRLRRQLARSSRPAVSAISATEPALGAQLAEAFTRPALTDIHARLAEAVKAGQIAETADLDATVDLLMAIIVYVGMSRQDVSRIPASIAILRSGITG